MARTPLRPARRTAAAWMLAGVFAAAAVATAAAAALPAPSIEELPTYTRLSLVPLSWRPVDGAAGYYVYHRRDLAAWTRVDIGSRTSWSLSGAAEGKWHFKVSAYDVEFQEGESSEVVFTTVDRTPPDRPDTFRVVTPMNEPHPTFHWSHARDAGSGASRYVVLMDGDMDHGHDLGDNTTWTWPADHPALETGTHWLTIICHDAAGNFAFYDFAFDIDTLAPGQPGMADLPQYVAATTCNLSWTAPDDPGPAGIAAFQLQYEVGENPPPFDAAIPASIFLDASATAYTFIALAPGATYNFRVCAIDAAGNVGPWSNVVTTTCEHSSLPAPALDKLADYVGGDTVRVSWGEVDGAADYVLEYSKSEAFPADATASVATAALSCAIADAPDGETLWFRVKARNHVPVESPWSAVEYTTPDRTAPARPETFLVLSAPNDPCPVFHWAPAADAGSGLQSYEVWVADLGSAGPWDLGPVNTWTWQGPALPTGSYTLVVACRDAVGNRAEYEFPFALDLTPPVIAILSPAPGASGDPLSTNDSSTIIAELDGFDPDFVLVMIDDCGVWVPPTAVVGNVVYYFSHAPFLAGPHTVKIRTRDAAGNEAVAEVSFTVTSYREGFGFGRLRFK